MRTLNPLIAAGVMVLVTGCASRPPKELLDARTAYANAERAPGGPLTPNDQRDAKLALDAAEREYDDEGDEASTRDFERYTLALDSSKKSAELEKIAGLEAKQTDRGLLLTLSGSVLFISGKSIVLPEAQKRIREVAGVLKTDPRHVTVVGHTDSKGSDEANQKLSEARAKTVRTLLAKEGVPPGRLGIIGMGESEPVATNETPDGRANNRRVELLVEDR